MTPLRLQFWPSGEEDWVPPPPPLEVDEEGDSEIVPRLASQIAEVSAAIAILAGGLAQVEPEELWFETPPIMEEEALPVQPVDDGVVVWIEQPPEEEFVISYLEDESGQTPSIEEASAVFADSANAEEEFVTNFTLDDALEDSPRAVEEEPQLVISEEEELPEQVVVTVLEDESGLIPQSEEEGPILASTEEEEFPTSISVEDEAEPQSWTETVSDVYAPSVDEEELPTPSLVPEDESGVEARTYEEVLGLREDNEADEVPFTISVDEFSPEPAPHQAETVVATLQDDTEELPEFPIGPPDDLSGDLAFVAKNEVETVVLSFIEGADEDSRVPAIVDEIVEDETEESDHHLIQIVSEPSLQWFRRSGGIWHPFD